MLSNANREQLTEMAEYIESEFGIADESGRILFYHGDREPEDAGERLAPLFSEMQNDEALNIYDLKRFSGAGYLFENVSVDSDELLFMFIRYEEEDPERSRFQKNVLALAAHGFKYRESQISKDLINIFKKLLIEGRRTVMEEQIEAVYGEFMSVSESFAVILVALNKTPKGAAADSDMICKILQELFGAGNGFLIIPIDYAKTAVVCPLHDEITYEYVLEYANMIQDTLLSEAMVDVHVAISSKITGIMNLNEAYVEADKAKNIGAIFEMQEKCFEYTKLGLEKMIYSIPIDACVGYINETFGDGFLKDKSSQELLNTVKVYLQNDLNVSEASRVLYIHRNTLMYRLEKFNKMTGLDCSKFGIGMKVGIALLILQFIENKEPALLSKV